MLTILSAFHEELTTARADCNSEQQKNFHLLRSPRKSAFFGALQGL
jgi:hypothetical protein